MLWCDVDYGDVTVDDDDGLGVEMMLKMLFRFLLSVPHICVDHSTCIVLSAKRIKRCGWSSKSPIS